jgi:hypothetical protein
MKLRPRKPAVPRPAEETLRRAIRRKEVYA